MTNSLHGDTLYQLQRTRALDAVRLLSAKHESQETGEDALAIFTRRWPRSLNLKSIQQWWHKATIGGAPAAWGDSLASPTDLVAEIVELSRPASIIGRLQPLARSAPIQTAMPAVTTAAANFAWAGAGRPNPLSSAAIDTVRLLEAVASGLIVVTEELLRMSKPGADAALRDHLIEGCAQFLDEQFIDASNTGSAIEPFVPAAITAGVSAAASSSGDPVEDLRTALAAYKTDGGQASSAVILISSSNAAALVLRSGAADGAIFAGLDARGGTLAGCPCIASDALNDLLVVFDVRRLLVADSGGMDLAVGCSVALEMLDNPTNSASTSTAANMVSMFQTNSVAIRLDRYISWAYLGPIAMINGANYLAEGGSPAE